MRDALVEASKRVHGVYGNGRGVQGRPTGVHMVMEGRPTMEGTEELEPIQSVIFRIDLATLAVAEPSEELKAEVLAEHPRTDFEGRWGYMGREAVATRVINNLGMTRSFLTGLVTATIDPEWVLEADCETVRNHASAIMAARGLARQCHELDTWSLNSD